MIVLRMIDFDQLNQMAGWVVLNIEGKEGRKICQFRSGQVRDMILISQETSTVK